MTASDLPRGRARALLLVSLLLGAAGCAGVPPQEIGGRPAAQPPSAGDAARVDPRVERGESARTAPAAIRRPGADLPLPGSADIEPPDERPPEAPASIALLELGRSERAAGSYAAAAAAIERALRIDPNNAALWLELGEIKLADDDPGQARMMGRKALTLAGGQPEIAARAERLIERAGCAAGGC